MANKQNLIPASDPRGHKLTADELSKGGKNSVIAKKKAKRRGEIWKEIMNTPLTNKKYKAALKELEVDDEDLTLGKYLRFLAIKKMEEEGPKVDDIQKIDDEIYGKLVQKTEATVVAPKPLVDLTQRKKNGV